MKTFIKIITFPIWFTLEVIAFGLTLFTIVGGAILSLVAFALSVYAVYLMAFHMNFKDGIICAVVAALCTPWGLPSFAASVINVIENISDKLRGV